MGDLRMLKGPDASQGTLGEHMSQQAVDPRVDLIDLSGLSLHDVDDLGDSTFAHALSEILNPAQRDGEAVALFDNRMA
ncbi:MAG: hypothetical protein QOE54_6387 [Streptosporangiaceae bacterium]|jgi:hypothetical protein|nr:hypothetical protein [Streptosporangiaceae bacterium]MDX6434021.1 hypothetical protein [Streptosporangiaceae bacterium]